MRDRRVVAAINRMEDFGISATDVAAREIELVARGYTVSARAAALGRVGGDYVMRDCDAARLDLSH